MTTPTYIREVDINESDGEFVIACIEKNGSQDVRVRLRELYGQTHVDVRVFTEVRDDDERQPTKKGVTLKVERLPELVDALQSAERKWRGKPD